jgi:hypothetical protein
MPEFGPEGKFWGVNKKPRSCDGRGGAQRPVLHVNESNKDGCAQRPGAHARPKPTSLSYICLRYFVSVCVTIWCGMLSYSFSFSNQTDQGDETEGLEREG